MFELSKPSSNQDNITIPPNIQETTTPTNNMPTNNEPNLKNLSESNKNSDLNKQDSDVPKLVQNVEDGKLLQWGCFLCNHPEKAVGFLRGNTQPVIEGKLKEKKGKWRLFRRWRTRYFTLSGAHLSCKGSVSILNAITKCTVYIRVLYLEWRRKHRHQSNPFRQSVSWRCSQHTESF